MMPPDGAAPTDGERVLTGRLSVGFNEPMVRRYIAPLAVLVLVGAAPLVASAYPYQFTTEAPTPDQESALEAVSDLALVREIRARHAATPPAIDAGGADDTVFDSVIQECKQDLVAGVPMGTCGIDAYTATLLLGRSADLAKTQRVHIKLGDDAPDPWEAIFWIVEILAQRSGPSPLEVSTAAIDWRTSPVPPNAIAELRDQLLPPFVAAAQAIVHFYDVNGLQP
jgi:hypothetical protein